MKDPKSEVWLTRRPEFLAAQRGRRHHAALFTLQKAERAPPVGAARFGLTVTSRTGNAVERNRMKRRLRAAIASGLRLAAEPGADYVVVGRRSLLDAPFTTIVAELSRGIARLKAKPHPSQNS
jgi:ribonuclease P protein component